jgi:uncharacterized protein (DUF1499 family)
MREPPPPPRSALAAWSLRLALMALLSCLLAIAGAQLQRLSPDESLALLGLGFALGSLALVLGGAALIAIWTRGLRGFGAALGGLVITLLMLAYPAYGLATSLRLPPINDITTDVELPPVFLSEQNTVSARPYPPVFAGEQRAAYPSVQPLVIDVNAAEAQRLAADSLTNLGLKIVDERLPRVDGDEDGYIEANDKSLLLRLVDDIIIRVKPVSKDETRIDIRSRSRIGRHDLGANARRVLKIIDELTRLAALQE